MDQQHLEIKPGSQRPPVKKAVLHNFRRRKMYFRGVPAPVGAAYALTPLMLRFCGTAPGEAGPCALGRVGTACTVLLTAVLMISPLPTFSSKMLKTDRDDTHLRSRHFATFGAKLGGGLLLGCLSFRFPFQLVLFCNALHFASIPIAIVVYHAVATDKSD